MIRMMGRLVAATLMVAVVIGCYHRATPVAADPSPDDPPPKRDKFAEDRVPLPAGTKLPALDGDRAHKYLKQLCDIGPRVSGSEGMAKQQDLLTRHFKAHGATVTRQEFKARQRSKKDEVPMTNLIATWFPEHKERIIFCCHYDTRPAAHEEKSTEWNKPFISANDGTSGVAIMMELAHHMKDFPSKVGVDFVFFDGEEYILDPGVPYIREGDKYFLGSEHFASTYAKEKIKLPYRYRGAILLDLCAHPNARLAVEGYSWQFAPRLVTEVWQTAEKLGAKSFKMERGFERAADVLDDHIALNQAGIPAVDIIDFDYAHWHRLTDTPEKCSPAQMVEVGNVMFGWLSTQS